MIVTLVGLVSLGAFARGGKDKDKDNQKKAAESLKIEDFIKKGEYDKAIELAKKFEAAGKVTEGLYIDLGVAYYNKKDYPNAIAAFEKAVEQNPFGTKALLYEVTCYNDMKQPQKILDTLQRVLDIDPTKTDVQYDVAQLCEKIAQDQNLISTIKVKDPSAPDAPAKTLTQKEWLDKALEGYQAIYDENPGYKDVAFATGLIYFNRGDFKKAGPYLEKAVSVNPDNDNVVLALGQDQLKAEQYKEATKTLAKYLEVTKNDTLKPAVMDQIAVAYEKINDYNNALVYYGKILELRPGSERALLGKGNALLQLKKYDEALPVLEQYMKVSHNDAKKKQVEKVIQQIKGSTKHR
jgi:tetratricopeptide (TPR) repeat protein